MVKKGESIVITGISSFVGIHLALTSVLAEWTGTWLCGRRQRLVLNLALRQRLSELLHALVRDLRAVEN